MFADWPSDLLPQNVWFEDYAIRAFKDTLPWNVGRDFVAGTAKHLYEGLDLKSSKGPVDCKITHDKQLQILMPALGYGLSFPLTEHEILRNCVSVYIEWLSALLPEPKASVPKPILKDPNHYATIIINHFYFLFVPRVNQAGEDVNRQALLCHRVLRTLQDVAKNSRRLNEDSWQGLLVFLLHVNSALLSPPSLPNDAGDQLGDRVLSVLFETWLMACSKCFPPPPLWVALRESCQRWRHRPGLVDQWKRITLALTGRLLCFMYGEEFASGIAIEQDIIPSEMSKDCIAQVWFRMLHIIGNPVDLSRQEVVSKTPAFLKYAISSDLVVEPCQHPCLVDLPQIFLNAMKGISALVDAFLGGPAYPGPTSGLADSQHFRSEKETFSSGAFEDEKLNFWQVKGRPKINSILHLFSPWLFEAALFNCSFRHNSISSQNSSGTFGLPRYSPQTSEYKHTESEPSTMDSKDYCHLTPADFSAGRAEAIGALCRIFCSKKTGEEILPVYLARFYLALKEGLQLREEYLPVSANQKNSSIFSKFRCSEPTCRILLNASKLFRLDLDGVLILVPSFLNVLNTVLFDHREAPSSEPSAFCSASTLRLSAIRILLSLLPLPLHFQDLCVKELVDVSVTRSPLAHCRSQLVSMLSCALQLENDAYNIQMLLAGLLFCVKDATFCEHADSSSQEAFWGENTSTVASSVASDSLLSFSKDEDGTRCSSLDFVDCSSPTLPPLLNRLSLPSPDSAHSLYVRAIYLVSHYLMSNWTKDVNVSLAGLELLSALAAFKFPSQDSGESKCAVKWLCDYIVFQCSRPPQAHSKDLHSMIVAAFHCGSVWLVEHPRLLNDEDVLSTVLEVIELGISGSKSKGRSGETLIFKHDKDLRPVSMRVRNAAEGLLSCVLSQVGTFPPTQGVESLSALLDERTLLKHCNSTDDFVGMSKEKAIKHVRYFVVHSSILIGLLEQPLGNHENPQPNVTMLIRGPFGRTAWTLQLRHLPRSLSFVRQHTASLGRPLPLREHQDKVPHHFRFFPEAVDRIPLCNADKSIPSLDHLSSSGDELSGDISKLLRIIDKQVEFEEHLKGTAVDSSSVLDAECSAPLLCEEFHTARLLLSQFGFLRPEGLSNRDASGSTLLPNVIALNSEESGFSSDLDELDSTNTRTTDTIHVFFVKSGQNLPQDILKNAESDLDSYPPSFTEFLGSLGWPVLVGRHSGWTGNISTSFALPDIMDANVFVPENGKLKPGLYDGRERILYWADAFSELAIILPSGLSNEGRLNEAQNSASREQVTTSCGNSEKDFSNGGKADDVATSIESGEGDRSSLPSQSSSGSIGFTKQRKSDVHCSVNYRMFVVWLQNLDDIVSFPKERLVKETLNEEDSPPEKQIPVYVIFIHPLSNGLFRIKLEGQLVKLNLAGPLVDDQIVSRRVLGSMVRQTALNLCRRKHLECDNYQPPHVKRKFKIQDMISKYQQHMNIPEFYTHMFSTCLG